MTRSEPLTSAEASFLAFERKGLPMHVAGIVILDGSPPLTMQELRAAVAARLRRIPKLHQKARAAVVGGWPSWVPAGRIDLGAHLFAHHLQRPGSNAQLYELCARIHEQPLERGRPLWEIHLIDGVSHHRQAVLIKTHHAITDGLAGIQIADALFDRVPATSPGGAPAMRFVENGARPIVAALQDVVGLALTAAGGLLALDGPFNGRVGTRRSFGAAVVSLEQVHRLKRELGGTVDDVLVAIVAAGLSLYLEEVGYPAIPPSLRAMLPVSMRSSLPGASLGNHVSAVFIDLPTHAHDLASLVRQVAAAKATLRTAHAAAGGAALVEAVGRVPDPIRTALLRVVSGLPFANLVMSDIPGPEQPQHLLGRPILGCFPMMPLAGNVGLSIATVSMGGMIGIGVTADPSLVPDVRRLAEAIGRSAAAWLPESGRGHVTISRRPYPRSRANTVTRAEQIAASSTSLTSSPT